MTEALHTRSVYGENPHEDTDYMDRFLIVLSNAAKVETFDFYTGVGLRMLSKKGARFAKHTVKGEELASVGTKAEKSMIPVKVARNYYKGSTYDRPSEWIVPPSMASVMYNLCSDYSVLDNNFTDWCDDYGMDCDSVKALTLYNNCTEQAKKLQKVLGDKTIRAMQDWFCENNF